MNLGSMPIRLQVDVGFGDQIVPTPQSAEFPALLAAHGPNIRSYSPETVIAEKFNAMIILGMANSRMKDYFDIWMLSRNFNIEADVLRDASGGYPLGFAHLQLAVAVDVRRVRANAQR